MSLSNQFIKEKKATQILVNERKGAVSQHIYKGL